jgi:hypothetical protein
MLTANSIQAEQEDDTDDSGSDQSEGTVTADTQKSGAEGGSRKNLLPSALDDVNRQEVLISEQDKSYKKC